MGKRVFSKHNITEHELEFGKVHSDAISCADLNIDGKDIILISLYGKMINGNAISTLHRCLSDLTHLFYKKKLQKWILIGGDFNADEALDETQRNRAHHLFLKDLKTLVFMTAAKNSIVKEFAHLGINTLIFTGKMITCLLRKTFMMRVHQVRL